MFWEHAPLWQDSVNTLEFRECLNPRSVPDCAVPRILDPEHSAFLNCTHTRSRDCFEPAEVLLTCVLPFPAHSARGETATRLQPSSCGAALANKDYWFPVTARSVLMTLCAGLSLATVANRCSLQSSETPADPQKIA